MKMGVIKFSHVVSFSSEDPKFPVHNLVKNLDRISSEAIAPWKPLTTDKSGAMEAILQMDAVHMIGFIDVGVYGNVCLELYVGRSCWQGKKSYEMLLPTQVISSSKTSAKKMSVQMFSKDNFQPKAIREKWDQLKISCRALNPFSSDIGVAFVRMSSTDDNANKPVFHFSPQKEQTEKSIFATKLDRIPTPTTLRAKTLNNFPNKSVVAPNDMMKTIKARMERFFQETEFHKEKIEAAEMEYQFELWQGKAMTFPEKNIFRKSLPLIKKKMNTIAMPPPPPPPAILPAIESSHNTIHIVDESPPFDEDAFTETVLNFLRTLKLEDSLLISLSVHDLESEYQINMNVSLDRQERRLFRSIADRFIETKLEDVKHIPKRPFRRPLQSPQKCSPVKKKIHLKPPSFVFDPTMPSTSKAADQMLANFNLDLDESSLMNENQESALPENNNLMDCPLCQAFIFENTLEEHMTNCPNRDNVANGDYCPLCNIYYNFTELSPHVNSCLEIRGFG